MGRWDDGTVGWWDGGTVGWWDGGMVGWWDGGMVGWWDGGTVGWWDGLVPSLSPSSFDHCGQWTLRKLGTRRGGNKGVHLSLTRQVE